MPAGTKTDTRYIFVPSADLTIPKNPGRQMGTQALYGQRFDLISVERGLAYGALYSVLPGRERIDYIGTVPAVCVANSAHEPTHRVSALFAAVFEQADIKSTLLGSFPRNAAVRGTVEGEFLRLHASGFIHLRHLTSVGEVDTRPYADVALDMLGMPYVWGGTGHVGVDCSGLVQSALAATGIDAPRDTDQQEASLGRKVSYAERKPGDLLFWPGHVGIVIGGDQLLHANAHNMAVATEPVEQAVGRIGAVRTVKRL